MTKEIRGSSRPLRIIYFFLLHQKLAFPIAYLRIRESSTSVIVSTFASDFDIVEVTSDGNLDEDLLFHSGFNIWKADRNEDNRR
jgi:hypothetical protein